MTGKLSCPDGFIGVCRDLEILCRNVFWTIQAYDITSYLLFEGFSMKRYFAWTLFLINLIVVLLQVGSALRGSPGAPSESLTLSPADAASTGALTVSFSLLGALIVLRADGNRVGWLMLLLGFVLANPPATYLYLNPSELQGEVSFATYFAVWTQGWFYFVILIAVFLIILHFPDGRPPRGRWNLVNIISLITFTQFILVYTFQPVFGDESIGIENPIALLPVAAEDTVSAFLFGLGLILLGFSSVISMVYRYRRSDARVRAQIKWVLYAGVLALPAIGYRLAVYERGVDDWTDYLLPFALLLIAAAISVAILRYRVYEIDIIIRRTLQYALLTGMLAIVFFGGVVFLQAAFQAFTGSEDSPLVTVISTLLIAALFNPLRARTQEWIDRRFYRAKYDAEKALLDFSSAARDEVDMDRLTARLVQVVTHTMKPDKVRLLLTTTRREEGQ